VSSSIVINYRSSLLGRMPHHHWRGRRFEEENAQHAADSSTKTNEISAIEKALKLHFRRNDNRAVSWSLPWTFDAPGV
jgi:hypothetical protein